MRVYLTVHALRCMSGYIKPPVVFACHGTLQANMCRLQRNRIPAHLFYFSMKTNAIQQATRMCLRLRKPYESRKQNLFWVT